ncbi:MAG: LamG domain-containing protein [Candidatus Thermoplasmatota archaeon]|nr:LamG domain-containing protein [Candidatus Thermoplasmatota archaeon]
MKKLLLIAIASMAVMLSGCIYPDHWPRPYEREEPFISNGDPIVHYRMDEDGWKGDKGEVKDSSATGIHGTALGGANTIYEGVSGRSGQFDGIDDLVHIGDHPSLRIKGKGLTMSAWVRVDDDSIRNMVIDKEESYEFRIDGGVIKCAIMCEYQEWYWMNTEAKVVIGEWSHVVITYDGVEIRVFVNALHESTISYPYGRIRFSDLPFSIGAGYKYFIDGWDWDYHFHGAIDEVKLYDRPLSSGEVKGLYLDSYE